MRTQEQRDETTIQTFTALLVFVFVLAAAAGLLWLGHLVFGIEGTVGSYVLAYVAAVVAMFHLHRHRRS